MKKFMVFYKASEAEFARAMSATPEQQKAMTEDWMAWSKTAGPAIVDMGALLGKTLRVTAAGASPSRNDLGGYTIMQGESKEAIGEALKGHPHLKMGDNASIEVVELIAIPGV